jgi:hypothetical protein
VSGRTNERREDGSERRYFPGVQWGDDPWRRDTVHVDGSLDDCERAVLLIATAPDMYAVLRAAEWSVPVRGVGSCCPSCGGEEIDGHRSGCALRAALAKADGR